jgi:hypothetical protein
MRAPRSAFSLLEVVIAIGLFALGIAVVVGLFAPVARSVGTHADAQTAVNIADLLEIELSKRTRIAGSFQPVIALFQNGPDLPMGSVRDDARILFADRSGSKLAIGSEPMWNGSEAPYFEVRLFRHSALSPSAADDTAIVLVYTARIAWPASRMDQSSDSALPAKQNATGQQVLIVNGAIRR